MFQILTDRVKKVHRHFPDEDVQIYATPRSQKPWTDRRSLTLVYSSTKLYQLEKKLPKEDCTVVPLFVLKRTYFSTLSLTSCSHSNHDDNIFHNFWTMWAATIWAEVG